MDIVIILFVVIGFVIATHVGYRKKLSSIFQIITSNTKKISHYEYILGALHDNYFVFGLEPDCITPTFASASVEEVLGFTPEEILSDPFGFIHVDDEQFVRDWIRQYSDLEQPKELQFRATTKSNEDIILSVIRTPIHDDNGDVVAIKGMARDVTDEHENNKLLHHLAYNDVLTGLPNRFQFTEMIELVITNSTRNNYNFSLMLIDMDNFKTINDTKGHVAGDNVLQSFAVNLSKAAHAINQLPYLVELSLENNSEACSVFRLGGDEFVLLIFFPATPLQLEEIATLLQEHINTTIAVDFGDNAPSLYTIKTSIGIAEFPTDGTTSTEILKAADHALYAAKYNGKNQFQRFSSNMAEKTKARAVCEERLREFIETKHKFILCGQPIITTDQTHIESVELLFRGDSTPNTDGERPCDGDLDIFFGVAEQTGMIVELGEMIIRESCKMIKRVSAETNRYDINFQVNLSTKQLEHENIVDVIKHNINLAGIKPSQFGIEVTETALIEDVEATIEKLSALREFGIMIAVDDFGKGFSSMSYLQLLPTDKLKIDMAFVSDIPYNSKNTGIVAGIIGLARTLELTTVAEGVETEDQRVALEEMGCDQIQGFLLSRALEEDLLIKFINNHN